MIIRCYLCWWYCSQLEVWLDFWFVLTTSRKTQLVCVFNTRSLFKPLLFPSRGRRTRTFSSEPKIDQADFTNWMPFISFILMEEISPNPEALIANTQTLSLAWNSLKDIRKCVHRAVYRAAAPALITFRLIFVSLFLDVLILSTSTVSFRVPLEILCLKNVCFDLWSKF